MDGGEGHDEAAERCRRLAARLVVVALLSGAVRRIGGFLSGLVVTWWHHAWRWRVCAPGNASRWPNGLAEETEQTCAGGVTASASGEGVAKVGGQCLADGRVRFPAGVGEVVGRDDDEVAGSVRRRTRNVSPRLSRPAR
ncbi:hypothetical protein [Streptomyces olivaceoviridis]